MSDSYLSIKHKQQQIYYAHSWTFMRKLLYNQSLLCHKLLSLWLKPNGFRPEAALHLTINDCCQAG